MKAFREAVRARTELVELVGQHVLLKRVGSEWVGLCPFHQERSPSFAVSAKKQLYHCHGCKKGGDAFRFLMDLEGITFSEALARLAERAQLTAPEGIRQQFMPPEKVRAKDRAYKLSLFATVFMKGQLEAHSEALRYLKERGFDPEFLREQHVGFLPASFDFLYQHLLEKRAPLDLAESLGLIRNGRDFFRGRVIFPVLDSAGRVLGFGGRLMPGLEGPKYLNSPESPIFQKSKVLYGLFEAQKIMRASQQVVVVEGYFDVCRLRLCGIQNVVATCGTALTKEHIQVLSKFAKSIVLAFDGDASGQQAMEKACSLGLAEGKILSGVLLPEGEDPDSWLQTMEGIRAFKEQLKKPRTLLDGQLDRWIESARMGAHERAEALEPLRKLIHAIPSGPHRLTRAEYVGKKLQLDPRWFLSGSSISLRPKLMEVTAFRVPEGDKILLEGLFFEEAKGLFATYLEWLPSGATLESFWELAVLGRAFVPFMVLGGLSPSILLEDPDRICNAQLGLLEDPVRGLLTGLALRGKPSIPLLALQSHLRDRVRTVLRAALRKLDGVPKHDVERLDAVSLRKDLGMKLHALEIASLDF